jgi:hypothetical protein
MLNKFHVYSIQNIRMVPQRKCKQSVVRSPEIYGNPCLRELHTRRGLSSRMV